jgi:hypothetical protein
MPKLIENGTSDTRRAICLKLHSPLRVESINSIHQSKSAGADKVVQLNLVRQFAVQSLSAIFYKVSVMFQKQIAGEVIVVFVETFPYPADIDLLVGFHGNPP